MAEPDANAVVAELDKTKAESLSADEKLKKDREEFDKITANEPFREPRPSRKQEKAKEPEPAEEPELEEEEEEEAPAPDPRIQEARTKLIGAGYPKTAVESSSDEEALAWWNRHNEADYDRASAKEQALELQRRLERLEKERAPKAPEEPPKPLLDPAGLSAALKEHLGDDVGDATTKAIADFVAPVLETLQGRIQELEKTWQDAEQRSSEAIRQANHQRLKEKIPQLQEPFALKALDAVAESLLKENGRTFTTADELYDEAAKTIYGENALLEKEDTKKQQKRIRSSLPSTESRRGTPERAEVSDDRAFFDKLDEKYGRRRR